MPNHSINFCPLISSLSSLYTPLVVSTPITPWKFSLRIYEVLQVASGFYQILPPFLQNSLFPPFKMLSATPIQGYRINFTISSQLPKVESLPTSSLTTQDRFLVLSHSHAKAYFSFSLSRKFSTMAYMPIALGNFHDTL